MSLMWKKSDQTHTHTHTHTHLHTTNTTKTIQQIFLWFTSTYDTTGLVSFTKKDGIKQKKTFVEMDESSRRKMF